MKPFRLLTLTFCLCILFSFTSTLTFAYPQSYEVKEEAAFVAEYDVSLPAAIIGEQNNNMSIQVFDVQKGKVILTTESNEQFQKFAHSWLAGIKQFAPEVQPDLKATYIFRVPLIPPVSLQVGQAKLQVAEIFMFYYKTKEPLLLVFDENKKPYLFHTSEDVTPFIKFLSIPD